jgi:hypothetical protein
MIWIWPFEVAVVMRRAQLRSGGHLDLKGALLTQIGVHKEGKPHHERKHQEGARRSQKGLRRGLVVRSGRSYSALQAPVTGERLLKAFGSGPAQLGYEFYFFLYIRDLFKFINV